MREGKKEEEEEEEGVCKVASKVNSTPAHS